ncbi:MAG: hypothetical protein RR068_12645, partial [Hafnia sp.]
CWLTTCLLNRLQPTISSTHQVLHLRIRLRIHHNVESTAAVVHSFRVVDDLHPKYSHRCILVSSEVSHRIATMVSRHVRAYLTLACTFRLPGWGSSINGTHPDRCGTCAICRTATHLKAHSTVWI